jgi:hypothetical protein
MMAETMRILSLGLTAPAHVRASSASTSIEPRGPRGGLGAASTLYLATAVGCAPTVNVLGVYFPAWLISAVIGLVVAYAAVWWLGRRSGRRALAQSGLLFCSLTVTVGLVVWWIFFSGF